MLTQSILTSLSRPHLAFLTRREMLSYETLSSLDVRFTRPLSNSFLFRMAIITRAFHRAHPPQIDFHFFLIFAHKNSPEFTVGFDLSECFRAPRCFSRVRFIDHSQASFYSHTANIFAFFLFIRELGKTRMTL